MRHLSRRREFSACRYALRHLLAAAHRTTAEYWRLDAAEGGAPRLDVAHHGEEASELTSLSLSHSGRYLACATGVLPLGVDLEVVDVRVPGRDVLSLATIACTDEEIRQLEGIECELTRHRLFLQWWTLKEAYFKCSGTGLDFSSIRRVECRAEVGASGRRLAGAKSWIGSTGDGRDVMLSVCVLESSDTYTFLLETDASIDWHRETSWSLIALPGCGQCG